MVHQVPDGVALGISAPSPPTPRPTAISREACTQGIGVVAAGSCGEIVVASVSQFSLATMAASLTLFARTVLLNSVVSLFVLVWADSFRSFRSLDFVVSSFVFVWADGRRRTGG